MTIDFYSFMFGVMAMCSIYLLISFLEEYTKDIVKKTIKQIKEGEPCQRILSAPLVRHQEIADKKNIGDVEGE